MPKPAREPERDVHEPVHEPATDVEPQEPTVPASEVERLMAEHAAALEEATKEAYERGHADAVAEIGDEARRAEEELRAQVDAASAALIGAVHDVEAARQEAVSVVEQEAAELAFKLTRTLVQRETVLSENATVDAIKRALALAPTNEAVLIRLNPDDIATLSGYDMSDLGRECTIVPDDDIEHAGCVAEVGSTRIDAQMGQALGRVRKALLGMHGPHHDDDPSGAPPRPGGAPPGGESNRAPSAGHDGGPAPEMSSPHAWASDSPSFASNPTEALAS